MQDPRDPQETDVVERPRERGGPRVEPRPAPRSRISWLTVAVFAAVALIVLLAFVL